MVEYQCELWRCHHYEYYEDERDADDEDNVEDEHIAAVEVSLGDEESSTG